VNTTRRLLPRRKENASDAHAFGLLKKLTGGSRRTGQEFAVEAKLLA